MPRIEITAKLWPQTIDGRRYERRCGDVVDASGADADRLIKVGAAKPTKRKINVADQKPAEAEDKPEAPKNTEKPDADDEAGSGVVLLPPDEIDMPMPAQAAKTELWQEYAIAAGVPEDVARAKSRDDLRQLFA